MNNEMKMWLRLNFNNYTMGKKFKKITIINEVDLGPPPPPIIGAFFN
jgi:hypothetical protein